MSDNERRQHPRQPANYPIEVACLDVVNDSKTEYLHNISDGGISFTTDDGERYRIDQQIMVSIRDKTENATLISANGKVIWVDHPAFDLNTATIGIHFEELIESKKVVG